MLKPVEKTSWARAPTVYSIFPGGDEPSGSTADPLRKFKTWAQTVHVVDLLCSLFMSKLQSFGQLSSFCKLLKKAFCLFQNTISKKCDFYLSPSRRQTFCEFHQVKIETAAPGQQVVRNIEFTIVVPTLDRATKYQMTTLAAMIVDNSRHEGGIFTGRNFIVTEYFILAKAEFNRLMSYPG